MNRKGEDIMDSSRYWCKWEKQVENEVAW